MDKRNRLKTLFVLCVCVSVCVYTWVFSVFQLTLDIVGLQVRYWVLLTLVLGIWAQVFMFVQGTLYPHSHLPTSFVLKTTCKIPLLASLLKVVAIKTPPPPCLEVSYIKGFYFTRGMRVLIRVSLCNTCTVLSIRSLQQGLHRLLSS